MFKRKGNDNNAEGAPAAKEQKTEPIPRHLPENVITLNFSRRGWEEIAPGFLYYLPLCQTPKYMFDQAMVNQFRKFDNMWETMEILSPSAKISNLIMLQDDLRVQNNTPTDATAFTQVVYMLKYCPVGQKQFFKLAHVPDTTKMTETKTLTYNLYPGKGEKGKETQFVKMTGFESFDNLAILPAKANLEAGFVPHKSPDFISGTNTIADPYIAPNSNFILKSVSGNMQPLDNNVNFQAPTKVLTMCQNQDKIDFYKYGDEFSIPINTNLEGFKLAAKNRNDFLKETQIEAVLPDKTKIAYATEWVYPSRNRPFLHRGNYYDPDTDPITQGKHFKPLNHCFLCMPPIRKPGGELLGQRCSLFLEQSVTIRFHASQAVFSENLEDNEYNVNQDNQILLRRNFYPTPVKITESDGPICGNNDASCRTYNDSRHKLADDKPCLDNNWASMQEIINVLSPRDVIDNFTFKKEMPSDLTVEFQPRTDGEYFFYETKTYAMDDTYLDMRVAWKTALKDDIDTIYCKITKPVRKSTSGTQFIYARIPHKNDNFIIYKPDETYKYMIINVKALQKIILQNSNTVCNTFLADPAFDKTSTVFFC